MCLGSHLPRKIIVETVTKHISYVLWSEKTGKKWSARNKEKIREFCEGRTLDILMVFREITPHYGDVTMSAMVFQITGISIVCSTIFWDADQRQHQSSASLAFVRNIHRLPVDSHYKGPLTRKIFAFTWWRHHGKFPCMMIWGHTGLLPDT